VGGAGETAPEVLVETGHCGAGDSAPDDLALAGPVEAGSSTGHTFLYGVSEDSDSLEESEPSDLHDHVERAGELFGEQLASNMQALELGANSIQEEVETMRQPGIETIAELKDFFLAGAPLAALKAQDAVGKPACVVPLLLVDRVLTSETDAGLLAITEGQVNNSLVSRGLGLYLVMLIIDGLIGGPATSSHFVGSLIALGMAFPIVWLKEGNRYRPFLVVTGEQREVADRRLSDRKLSLDDFWKWLPYDILTLAGYDTRVNSGFAMRENRMKLEDRTFVDLFLVNWLPSRMKKEALRPVIDVFSGMSNSSFLNIMRGALGPIPRTSREVMRRNILDMAMICKPARLWTLLYMAGKFTGAEGKTVWTVPFDVPKELHGSVFCLFENCIAASIIFTAILFFAITVLFMYALVFPLRSWWKHRSYLERERRRLAELQLAREEPRVIKWLI